MAISTQMAKDKGIGGNGNPKLEGLNKTDWEAIEGEIVTISDIAEAVNKKGETLYAIMFEEYNGAFFWGGASIQKLITTFGIDDVIGTKLSIGGMVKTKQGNTCRDISIVD